MLGHFLMPQHGVSFAELQDDRLLKKRGGVLFTPVPLQMQGNVASPEQPTGADDTSIL